MKIRFKKLNPDAVIPTKAHATDAGFDLVATSRVFDKHGCITYGTGIAVEIPQGYMGLVFPRSSNAKKDLLLSNSVGIIDSGYRGEIMAKFKPSLVVVDKDYIFNDPYKVGINDYDGVDTTLWETQQVTFHGRDENYPDITEGCKPFPPRFYEVGERIAQLVIVPYPEIEFEEAKKLSDSDRGTGAYGSTGK